MLTAALLLLGCSQSGAADGDPLQTVAPPTVHPGLTGGNTQAAPGATAHATAGAAAPPPTFEPTAPAATVTPETPVARTITIFDEALDPDWTLSYSTPAEPVIESGVAYQGEVALAFSPTRAYAELIVALREDAALTLRRDEVISVQFWVNAGDGVIETGDLGLIVTGSDALTYYDPDDNSVEALVDECDPFCFTRLYFLGFNRAIPPDTWSEVRLRVDALQFDPLTEYVTGFIIASGETRYQTIYIDRVEVTLLENSE